MNGAREIIVERGQHHLFRTLANDVARQMQDDIGSESTEKRVNRSFITEIDRLRPKVLRVGVGSPTECNDLCTGLAESHRQRSTDEPVASCNEDTRTLQRIGSIHIDLNLQITFWHRNSLQAIIPHPSDSGLVKALRFRLTCQPLTV